MVVPSLKKIYDLTNSAYYLDPAAVGTSLKTAGDIITGGDILPDTDNTLSLGSASYRFKDLYLGPGSLKVVNSYTDASNYEFGTLSFNSNVMTLATSAAGTGSVRALQLKTGSNNGIYLDTNGKVGVGTTSPQGNLEIFASEFPTLILNTSQADEAGDIQFQETNGSLVARIRSTAAGADESAYLTLASSSGIEFNSNSAFPGGAEMFLTNTGRLGIGTTSPHEKLGIVNGIMYVGTNNTQFGAQISGSSQGRGLFGSNLYIDNSSIYRTFGTHSSYGYSGINANWGNLDFYTSSGATTAGGAVSPSVRMRIDANGDVGIGTNDPSHKLTISTSDSNDGINATNGTSWMRLLPGTTGAGSYNPIITAGDNALIFTDGSSGTGNLVIAPWSTSAGGIKISGNGNVGIGTDPAATARLKTYMPNGSNMRGIQSFMDQAVSTDDYFYAATRVDSGQNWVDTEFKINGSGQAFTDGGWNGAADLAEYFYSSDLSLQKGDLVTLSSTAPIDGPSVAMGIIEAADQTDLPLGVISTNPGFIGMLAEDTTDNEITLDENNPHYQPVGLLGQVPVKVTNLDGEIGMGDPVAISSLAKYGSKATDTGYIVGYATQATTDWNEQSCALVDNPNDINWPNDETGTNKTKPCYQLPDGSYVGKIMVYVNPTWYEDGRTWSELALALRDQQLQLDNQTATIATLTDTQNSLIDQLTNLTQSLAQSLTTQLLTAQTVITDNLQIAGQNIDQYIKDTVQTALNNQELTIPTDVPVTSDQPLMLDSLSITNDQDEVMAHIDNQGNAQLAGDLEVAGDLVASGSSQLDQLAATDITTDNLETNTAQINQATITDATISGQLHASSIEADVIAGLQERLETAVASQLEDSSLLASLFDDLSQSNEQYLQQLADDLGINIDQPTATDSAQLLTGSDLSLSGTLLANNAYLENYFEVNGSALINQALAVGQTLMVGNGLTMGDGYIAYAAGDNYDLAIQPSGRGRLSLMASLMTLDEAGLVTINGDLQVAGALTVSEELRAQDTLLTNLIKADNPEENLQIQLAQTVTDDQGQTQIRHNNLEFVDQDGTPVATMSAQGNLTLSGGLAIDQPNSEATAGAQLNQASAGQAVIAAGQTTATIYTSRLSENSMIYITPLNSTNNQVIYVQAKVVDDPLTSEFNEAHFMVGFDFALAQDVSFNWWLVN